jgi:hypothetical protein
MGWTVGVRFPAGARYFSLLRSIQTGPGAHPDSYPMGTGSFSPGVKRPGHETDHLSPSIVLVELYLHSSICLYVYVCDIISIFTYVGLCDWILLRVGILKHITRDYFLLNWCKITNIEYASKRYQVNLSLFLIKYHAMETYGEVEAKLSTFLKLWHCMEVNGPLTR